MYSKILVPVDGSAPSQRGLAEAIKLAHALNGSIRLIHVVDIWPLVASEASAASYDVLYEGLRLNGAKLLREGLEAVKRHGVEVDTVLVEAPDVQIGECIVRRAREYQADLIVCGTHGRRGVRRLLVGSDAEYIVRHASVPVLLVRAPEASQEKLVGAAA